MPPAFMSNASSGKRRNENDRGGLVQKEAKSRYQDRYCPETNDAYAKPELIPHSESIALSPGKHNATD